MSTRGAWDDAYLQATDFLPQTQYTSISQASGTIAPSAVLGACETVLATSGATALTTPSANALYTAGLGAAPTMIGFIYNLRIINTNAGTLTLTAGTGVTINGTATIATNTWRDFIVTIAGPNVATWQAVGTGTTS